MKRNPSTLAILGLLAAWLLSACVAAGPNGEIVPIFVAYGTAAAETVAAATPTPVGTPTPAPTPTPLPTPPPFDLHTTDNLLVLGTDRRPEWTIWRTDSIMVVGIDRDYGRIAVLSIPRDLYVDIPGYGKGRINQADYLGEKVLKVEGGGPALVSQVISNTLGISTNHWVRIDMAGFPAFVDALGGVTVHLDCPFYELIYDLDEQAWTFFELPAGDVQMDGITAYRFVSLRLLESDFGRSRRQRQFLWALRNQALRADLILRLPELWTAFQETFSTDLSIWQVVDLATFIISLDANDIRAAALTSKQLQSYTTEKGASVLRIADPAKVQELIDNIWDAPPMAATNRRDPANCPAKPQRIPGYVSTVATPGPPPTPAPSPTPTE